MHSENRNLILVLALWSLMLLPWLFGRGIFADGLYYGTIARNWCFGTGDLWDFQVSESLMNPFYSHPPLAFWLEGTLFCVFGDYWWIDRIFGLLTFIFTATGIVRIWRLYFPTHQSWLPLFILMLLPTSVWAFNNNVLENSMGMFCVWAVYFQLSASKSERLHFLKFIISGLLVFAAALCKGPTGLFPLVLPFILLIFQKRMRFVSVLQAFIPSIVFFIALSILLLWDDASKYLYDYYQIQIQGSFSMNNNENQALMLKQFLLEVLPLLSIALLLKYWFTRNLNISKETIILLSIAGAASLPILISPKQMGFYLMPSLPYWALGIAGLIHKITFSNSKIAGKLLPYFSVLIFTTAVILMMYNFKKPVRDFALLEDVDKICAILPKETKVGLDPKLSENWKMQGYFAREQKISFDPIGHPQYKYHIGSLEYKLETCELIYRGKELQLCKCPMPE